MRQCKITDQLKKRCWYLFPILWGGLGYSILGLHGVFLATISVIVSSAITVICGCDEWISERVRNKWVAMSVSSVLIFLLLHGISSIVFICEWCRVYQASVKEFFMYFLWTNLLVTPLWMALLAILVSVWLTKALKNHPLLLWGGWALCLCGEYLLIDIMNGTGMRDMTTLFTIGDYIEIGLVILFTIGIIISCMILTHREEVTYEPTA